MKTFYCDETKEYWYHGYRYRFRVTLRTSIFTGEAFHYVDCDTANITRDISGNWKLSGRYYDRIPVTVHCCESALEAAMFAASKLGIEFPAY